MGESRWSGGRSGGLRPPEAAPLFTRRLLFLFWSFVFVLVFWFVTVLVWDNFLYMSE
jgi:hypothetical protein